MDKNTLYEALAGFNGVTNIKLDSEKRAILSNLKSATIIQYTIKGRFMSR